MSLSPEQIQRFQRQITLPEIGRHGQRRLAQARVLVVGAGGLGSPAALYLVAAGVGTIGLMDGDRVEIGNLQRQILYATRDIRRLKTDVAAERLMALNPDVRVNLHPQRLNSRNARHVFKQYDFIIDAVDSVRVKLLIAAICHDLELPYSHAGVNSYGGQAMTVYPRRTTCLRCLLPGQLYDRRVSRGPLGAAPGVLGTIQAAETIKTLLGLGEPLVNRVLIVDLLAMDLRLIPVKPNPACPLCGKADKKA